MNTFGPPKLALVRGEGAVVWDADGKQYVDLLGGIAVNALGHDHPAIVEAVTDQLRTLGHVSNFFTTEPQVALAEKLLDLLHSSVEPASVEPASVEPASVEPVETTRPADFGKVFFSSSGAEANEAALKLTRRTGRTHVVAMAEGFHGRTMGALALTSKAAYREPFEPLPGGVTFVPFGDVDALREAVTEETAAVVLEPLQGEAGVNPATDDYLRAAREITTAQGALLWFDEVQTGMGRAGAWFAHARSGVVPDVVTLAKGLGGGIPIGATIGVGAAADLLQPGNHGTTFGGNPVATRAALAVIDTIERDGLMEHALEVGRRLREGLGADERVTETRGTGLLIGLTLSRAVSAHVVAHAQEAGWIVNAPTPDRIRLAPPLVLTTEQVEAFVAAWPGLLDAAYAAEEGPS
ncbi:acetylornithine transaminase [Nocardioides marmoraquaticus]